MSRRHSSGERVCWDCQSDESRRKSMTRAFLAALLLAAPLPFLVGEEPTPGKPKSFPRPAPSSAKEPLAKALSLSRAGEFLDGAVRAWTEDNNCGSCHTSYAYLMARPR